MKFGIFTIVPWHELTHASMAVENTRRGGRARRHKGPSGLSQLDGDARGLVVDAVRDEERDDTIAAMGVENEKALEAMLQQASGGFDIDRLDRFEREGDRARKPEVVRRVAGEQDGSDEHVGSLGNELRALDAVQDVRPDGELMAVLLERTDGNDDHVGASGKCFDFGPAHMRQVILDFLGGREWIRLRFRLRGAGQHDYDR